MSTLIIEDLDVDSKLILISAMGIRSVLNIGSWYSSWLPEIEPQILLFRKIHRFKILNSCIRKIN